MAKTCSKVKGFFQTDNRSKMRGLYQEAYISSEITEYKIDAKDNTSVKTCVTVSSIKIINNTPFVDKILMTYEEPLKPEEFEQFKTTELQFIDAGGQVGLLANIKSLADRSGNTYFGLSGDDIVSWDDFLTLIPTLPEYVEPENN